jgi:hypothetical protein
MRLALARRRRKNRRSTLGRGFVDDAGEEARVLAYLLEDEVTEVRRVCHCLQEGRVGGRETWMTVSNDNK